MWRTRGEKEVDQFMTDAKRTDATLVVPGVEKSRARVWRHAVNWRLLVVRLVTSGLAVTLTVLVTPGLSFTGWGFGEFWLVAGVYAVIGAFVKPLLQFFSLRFLVASYGLINIVVNALLLWLLTVVLSDLITYDRVWQLLLGGFTVGVLSMVFDAMAGTSYPVQDTRAATIDREETS